MNSEIVTDIVYILEKYEMTKEQATLGRFGV